MKQPTPRGRAVSASERVVGTVADAEDADPTELPALYEAIDPDALDSLVESSDEDLCIDFGCCGYDITVIGEETVEITKRDD